MYEIMKRHRPGANADADTSWSVPTLSRSLPRRAHGGHVEAGITGDRGSAEVDWYTKLISHWEQGPAYRSGDRGIYRHIVS